MPIDWNVLFPVLKEERNWNLIDANDEINRFRLQQIDGFMDESER